MGVSDARSCKVVIQRTGKRCRQPAMKGADVCRFHASDVGRGVEGEGDAKSIDKPAGAQRENANALRHGAYTLKLQPDEEPVYMEKRKAFTDALGTVDVFDEQIVHLLALISTKVDQAVMKGAEHAAYGGMIKQILDLMQQLKVTRASRDKLTDGQGLTYADLFASMKAHVAEESKEEGAGLGEGEAAQKSVEQLCVRCGFSRMHSLGKDGRWRCLNCGHRAEIKSDDVAPNSSDKADEHKDDNNDTKQAGIA